MGASNHQPSGKKQLGSNSISMLQSIDEGKAANFSKQDLDSQYDYAQDGPLSAVSYPSKNAIYHHDRRKTRHQTPHNEEIDLMEEARLM